MYQVTLVGKTYGVEGPDTAREKGSENMAPANRDKSGRFQKGQSGNPEGRKPLAPELRDMLLPLGEKSVNALKSVLESETAKDADKLRAAEIVMDRLLGKATQPIVADVHTEEKPVTLAEMMTRARELLGDG